MSPFRLLTRLRLVSMRLPTQRWGKPLASPDLREAAIYEGILESIQDTWRDFIHKGRQ